MPKTKEGCSYKGSEPSPKGLGVCAHLSKEGLKMVGNDGNMWVVKLDVNGRKAWRRYRLTAETKSKVIKKPIAEKEKVEKKKPTEKKPVEKKAVEKKKVEKKPAISPKENIQTVKSKKKIVLKKGEKLNNYEATLTTYYSPANGEEDEPYMIAIPKSKMAKWFEIVKNSLYYVFEGEVDYTIKNDGMDATIKFKDARTEKVLEEMFIDNYGNGAADGWMEGDINIDKNNELFIMFSEIVTE